MFHHIIFIVSYYDGTDEQNVSFQQPKHPVGNTPAYSSFSALSNPKRPLLPGITIITNILMKVIILSLLMASLHHNAPDK